MYAIHEEFFDLGADPKREVIRRQLETQLRSIFDPEAVNAMDKPDKMAIVNANGGIEATVAKGGLGATSTPRADAEIVNQE